MTGEKETNYCPTCNSIVETVVMYSYHYDQHYQDEVIGSGKEIVLCKCLNCGKPILNETEFNEVAGEFFPWNKAQLYPNRDSEALKNAPDIVTRPYQEAIKCYRAHAYDACVIMCRKGIEAICLSKGEKYGNLLERLKNLHNKKVLEETLFKWTNEMRLLGNDGAHSHDVIVTKDDAKDAVEFFDALLLYMFHLNDKYEKFLERRNRKPESVGYDKIFAPEVDTKS